MDHRELLKKYISHVGECEGVTFIGCGYFMESERYVRFTEAEAFELALLEDQARSTAHPSH